MTIKPHYSIKQAFINFIDGLKLLFLLSSLQWKLIFSWEHGNTIRTPINSERTKPDIQSNSTPGSAYFY